MCKCWIVWLKLKMCESWQRQRRVIRQTEEEFGKASSFRVSQTDTFTTNTRCFWFLVLKACLWAEAITSVLSTCRVPLPALMAVTERAQEGGSQTLDYVLDRSCPYFRVPGLPHSSFPSLSLFHSTQPSLSKGASLQKSSAIAHGYNSLLHCKMESSYLLNVAFDLDTDFGLWMLKSVKSTSKSSESQIHIQHTQHSCWQQLITSL